MYTSYSDGQLAQLLKNGDEAAFTEIYNRYWKQLLFIAHKRLHSADDAKEVVQNVFLTLWQKRQTLQINSLPVYLSAMTRHTVYRFWANVKQRDNHLKIAGQQMPEPAASPDFENKQLLDLLAKFAEGLPEKYRLVFISYKILDQPLEQVAEQLGVSPRTAEGYVSKVLEIMRKRFDKVAFSAILTFFS